MILITIVVAADRTALYIRDCTDCFCGPSNALRLESGQETIKFDAIEPCQTTDVELVAGTTYRFDVDVLSDWSDGALRAGPDGLVDAIPLSMRAFTPFRRRLMRPWFELTGQIGRSDGETFAIGAGTCYAARSDGALYLYVNDAVSGFVSGRWWAFPYFWSPGQNRGTASLTITALGRSSQCGRVDPCGSCAK